MKDRIVFLDYLRIIACFMVIVIHSTEPYYLGNGGLSVANCGDFGWVVLFECLCRACVPLFVMASAYLLFPVTKPTGEFFRRRFLRIAVPFAIWSVVYVWLYKGNWGYLAFNFPDAGGHLWFVPMLLGLYLVMPLLSPWAERVTERELKGWLGLWAFTLTFPFLRVLWCAIWGAPPFGSMAYLWGECPWNAFGTFHYVSGFLGYMLLGFYFRKFATAWSWTRTLGVAVPLWLVGAGIMAVGLWAGIGGKFPVAAPYAAAVELERPIEYCSVGVAMTVVAYFLVIRMLNVQGWLYARVVRPLAMASYGTYLVHLAILLTLSAWLKPHLTTSVGIVVVAALTFVIASAVSLTLGKIPKIGKWVFG